MAVLAQPGRKKAQATLNSSAAETDGVLVQSGDSIALRVVGTYTGTVQLQRSFNGGESYDPVEDYAATGAANTQKDIIASANIVYKLVMSAYTSGSASATLLTS